MHSELAKQTFEMSIVREVCGYLLNSYLGDLAAAGKRQIQIITNTVTFSDRKI